MGLSLSRRDRFHTCAAGARLPARSNLGAGVAVSLPTPGEEEDAMLHPLQSERLLADRDRELRRRAQRERLARSARRGAAGRDARGRALLRRAPRR